MRSNNSFNKIVTIAFITAGAGLGLLFLIGISLPRSVWDKQASVADKSGNASGSGSKVAGSGNAQTAANPKATPGSAPSPAPSPGQSPSASPSSDVPPPSVLIPGSPGASPVAPPSPTSPKPPPSPSPSPSPSPAPAPSPTPPATPCGSAGGSCTAAQIATHNSATNCWVIYSGNYYIITSYVNQHPGGTSVYNATTCGQDISDYLHGAKSSAGKTHTHSNTAYSILSSYRVGPVN